VLAAGGVGLPLGRGRRHDPHLAGQGPAGVQVPGVGQRLVLEVEPQGIGGPPVSPAASTSTRYLSAVAGPASVVAVVVDSVMVSSSETRKASSE